MDNRQKWIAFTTIVRREVNRFMRIWPQTLVPPVITIVLYFVIFGQLIGGRIGEMAGLPYIQFVAPGL
ncbi:MAG: ABC transporter permease, partial [Porticoccaceae bacterium]